MKKIYSFFAVAAMLSLACACNPTTPEDPNTDPGKDPGKDPEPTETSISEITATLSGAGVKTAWAEGDAVIVYAVTESGDVDAKYVLESGAGTTSATFKVDGTALPTGASAYYASYPYSSISFAQHNTFAYTIEAEQAAGSQNPVFGKTTDGKAYTFSTPLAGLELKMTGSGNAARISIEDKNSDVIINGNVEYNAMTNKLKIKNASASKNTVAKSYEPVALGTNPASFLIEVPAGALATGATIIVYNAANGMIGKAELPAQDLKAGTLTSVNVALEEVSSVADLSALESANCYMITEPGEYKFKTVTGNENSSVGQVATAEILWESYCNNEEVVANSIIAECSYANDYITFKTPKTLKKGNAVIAAKDAAGVILWSWHIWVIADLVIDGTDLGYEGSGTLMNYNLGAVGEPGTAEGYGLLYAFGRKDPFLNAGEIGGSEPATVAGVATTNTESQATVDEDFVIQNPTVWVLVTGNDEMKDWLTSHDGTRWNADKGVHDPCPAGWRVPTREDNGFFSDTYQKNEEGTIIYFNKDHAMPYVRGKNYTDGVITSDGKYFTCEASGDMYAYAYRLSASASGIRRKAEGNSVRCVKVTAAEE